MTLNPYTYLLPDERIAQRPIYPPDAAKMLVVDRKTGRITDARFSEINDFLSSESHIVFNDTRVIPARLFGELREDAVSEAEILLVKPVSEIIDTAAPIWECIGRPLKKIKRAATIYFGDTVLGEVLRESERGSVMIRFSLSSELPHTTSEELRRLGSMPIPPYIRDGRGDEDDKTDYQSMFAREDGSVAAPTASLHFTPELVSSITKRGVDLSFVTLHVGTASFQPVIVDGLLRPPGSESISIDTAEFRKIQESKRTSKKIVAVGTTVVRALESKALGAEHNTELFITPGFKFEVVDALVTNFHQPGTTHLLLVESLLGRDLLNESYSFALNNGYRFLSYGDGMLIL